MNPVGTVNVGITRRAEHHGVALGRAPKAVRRRVGVVIGLDLDDGTADPIDQQHRPDQLGSHLMNASGEERTVKPDRAHAIEGIGDAAVRCLWRERNI